MESEFLQKVKNYFTLEFKQQIGLSLDEDSGAIDRALDAAIPAGMAAAIHKSHNREGDVSVADMAFGAAEYFPASPDVAKLHNEEDGARIATDLLGDHEITLRHALAKYAGLKNESAGALLMLTMPVLMGSLGIHAREERMNAAQFRDFIQSQQPAVRASVPDGFEPAVAVFDRDDHVKDKQVQEAIQTDAPQRKNTGWIIPIILVILAVLMLIYFSRGCNSPPEAAGGMVIPFQFW